MKMLLTQIPIQLVNDACFLLFLSASDPFLTLLSFNFSHAALMDPLTLLDYATPTLRFLRPLSLTRQYHPVALSRWVRKRGLLSV